MRFKLTLLTKQSSNTVLPINYQYPTSAAIYKIIEKADAEFSAFLHDKGYGDVKKFKLFTFSDIRTKYKIEGDQMKLLTNEAEIIICFHVPNAAQKFIEGIFIHQEIDIADKRNKVTFLVSQVQALPSIFNNDLIQEIQLQPISPIIAGIKNEKGNYIFLSPEHKDFTNQLMYNWKEKYTVVYGDTINDFEQNSIEVIFYRNPPKSRLVTIKADTIGETKIRGFTNFKLKVKGDRQSLDLLLNAGVGIYNSLGMGCVE